MPFKKDDDRINRNGRPVGSKNKGQLRDFIAGVLDLNKEKFQESLSGLKNAEFVKLYLEAMQYALPKLKAIEINETATLEQFLRMTPDERSELINELQNKLNNGK